MTDLTSKDAASHYNFVSDAWRLIFGDNFHFGYFRSDDMSLSEATKALIEELANLYSITGDSKILDVGCGIGAPAFYLHKKYGCSIIGITTSEKGVKLATENCSAKGYSDKVQFELADALNNGFPDKIFDIVWVMESSHLMKDKKKLFSENYRVLKDNTAILLCDMILKKEMNELDIVKYHRKISVMENVFGKAKTETLEYYQKGLLEAGFKEVKTIDVSENVFPTFDLLRKSTIRKFDKLSQYITKEKIDEFLLACDIVEQFYENNILGYGLVKAEKISGS